LLCAAVLAIAASGTGTSRAAATETAAASAWAQPAGTAAMAAGGVFYLSVGTNIAMGPDRDLVLEVATTRGNHYGCHTTSSGGWASVGAAFFPARSPSRRGFFWEPLLNGRYFHTAGGESSRGFFGCAKDTLDGSDADLQVGLDIGYQLRFGSLLVVPVIGARAGYCWNCVGRGPTSLPLLDNEVRTDRPVVGLNLNLVRVGMIF
jgi:hypothetical protein